MKMCLFQFLTTCPGYDKVREHASGARRKQPKVAGRQGRKGKKQGGEGKEEGKKEKKREREIEEKEGEKEGKKGNQSPKGNMWYAVTIALLCMSMLDEDEAGQRPRRGQNPVEHRRTFVRSSVHPSIHPSVRPPICPPLRPSLRPPREAQA